MAHPIWESDWFPRALARVLDHESAMSLAVCALLTSNYPLSCTLVRLQGELAPISMREVLLCAATHGDWEAVVALQRRCRPTSQRHRRPQPHGRLQTLIDDVEIASATRVSDAMRSAMWLQRLHPVQFPSSAVYAAARRGAFHEVAWLHTFVAYEPHQAIESAARGCHARVLQWLLDRCLDQDEDKDEPRLECLIRVDDPDLHDLELISWRDSRRRIVYCFIKSAGLLPQHRELRSSSGYPLMDWAAAQGNMALLKRFAGHPVTSASLSALALPLAAGRGHLDVVQWLVLQVNEVVESSIARAMAEAANRGDMEMLQWMDTHKGTRYGSLNVVLEGAARSGRIDALRWAFEHCLCERILPRFLLLSAAGAGNLEVTQYLHHDQGYGLGPSALERAVAHGQLEVAQWMYSQIPALSGTRKAILVSMAAKCGEIKVLKWVAEDLKLWSDQAIENAPWASNGTAVQVLEYLQSREVPNFISQLAKTKVIQLVKDGRFDVAEWILAKCPESASVTGIPSCDLVRFSQLGRRWIDSNGSIGDGLTAVSRSSTMKMLELFLQYRPQFCCAIRKFPEWAVREGNIRWLEYLEAMGHVNLFTDSTLDVILRYTRNASVLQWFLKRRPLKPRSRVAVIRWAAQYAAVGVLGDVLDVLGDGDHMKCVSVGVWTAARTGHIDAIQLLCEYIDRIHVSHSRGICHLWESLSVRAPQPVRQWIEGQRLLFEPHPPSIDQRCSSDQRSAMSCMT